MSGACEYDPKKAHKFVGIIQDKRIEISRIAVTGIIAILYWQQLVPVYVLWAAIAIGLYPLAKKAVIEGIRERKIGTELFITIATLTAVFGGETVAGAVLMVIILIAEFIAELNTDRARASIKNLIGSVPTTAVVRDGETERTVAIANLKAGDIVLVREGEKIPIDGTVIHGNGTVNEAPITGESIPKDKAHDDHVFAGTIVEAGAFDIRVEQVGRDTTFARIISLVEEAESHQAPVQKLVDKVAKWLIPAVFIFLIIVYLATQNVLLIVTLLIFTSPAELGLATPLVMIAAIARAARSGVLVKGGIYLESLAKIDTVVFDKTGTLTANKSHVTDIEVFDSSFEKDELLAFAAAADRRSAHPLAKAIVDYAIGKKLSISEPTYFEQVRGRGVKAIVEKKEILVGNSALLRENRVEVSVTGSSSSTPVHVSINGKFAGVIMVGDMIRPGAKTALAELRNTGVKRIIMLTGDNESTAKAVTDELGIDEYRANLLPQDKVAIIREIQQGGTKVVMVGDGINDAPALAAADVSIAMGRGGTQAAMEAADIVLMTDDLAKIAIARTISRRAYRTIQENLIVGVGVVHILGITAALLGWIGPIQAAILHLGPDVLVFLNSVKLLKVKLVKELQVKD